MNIDLSKYASKYNTKFNTNFKFLGNISIEGEMENNDFNVRVNLVVLNDKEIVYDNVKDVFIKNNSVFNYVYNCKTISLNQYHLIDILDEIILHKTTNTSS